jgi:phytoene synthase
MFSMMWRTYRALLRQIQDDPMKVMTHRVALPLRTQLNLALHHFITPMFDRLPVPPQELCGLQEIRH